MPTSSAPPVPASAPREVDTIIHAKWLIPMTEKGLVLNNYSLAIKDHKILAIAETGELNKRFTSQKEFHLDTHAVIPGLINSHGHSPMTLFRGFADDMALKPWLEDRIWPAENKWVNEEFVSDGARLAIAEMLLSGTTCFTDMYFFPDCIAKVAMEARIRAQLASPVLDFPTVWAQDAEEYIRKATSLYDQYKNNDFIYLAFGPHAPYTVSDEPLQKISMLAQELDIAIHMHVHENAQEIEDSIKATGKRPLQRLHELGLLSPLLQCVHMTQLNDDEIALLADNAVTLVHCPASNLKLANGLFRGHDALDAGINICLGTDGAASNNELNMFNEMRLAALLGKSLPDDASAMPAWQVLEMATINGAKTMGLGDKTGSLEVGKFADIVAVDLNHINTQPVYDPISTLVYSTQASQVSHVWVGGHLNVEDGSLLVFDRDHLIRKSQAWAEKISQEVI